MLRKAPFAFQKGIFYKLKGHLSQRERWPLCKCLIINLLPFYLFFVSRHVPIVVFYMPLGIVAHPFL